ncbi:unnamed protein product [Lepidochelys kempii]
MSVHQAEWGREHLHGIFLSVFFSLLLSLSPSCFTLSLSLSSNSPCSRQQNGTLLFQSQPAAVTQQRQQAACAKSEPTLSFRMTHWDLALISLFLVVDGEQPKSYTGSDQGEEGKTHDKNHRVK